MNETEIEKTITAEEFDRRFDEGEDMALTSLLKALHGPAWIWSVASWSCLCFFGAGSKSERGS